MSPDYKSYIDEKLRNIKLGRVELAKELLKFLTKSINEHSSFSSIHHVLIEKLESEKKE